jgi:hypothetical protein
MNEAAVRAPLRLIFGLGLLLSSLTAQGTGQIPADYFGLHISNVQEWPPFPVRSVRVANVAWGTINPTRGRYNWSALDRAVEVAARHQADISYLFLKTPQWASQRPAESCYAGAVGCAAPPADLADWDAFVGAVATRYKGRITSYEIWNEPNDRRFWTGSIPELVEMERRASRIIKSIDPGARVISPSPTYTKEAPPAAWLDKYLGSGGAENSDVIGFHGYVAAKPESVRYVVRAIKDVMARNGVNKDLWDTEAGWGRNATIADEEERAAFVLKSYLIQWSEGVRRFYWYQWDNPDWGTLTQRISGMTKAGRAFARAQTWMVGAVLPEPCREKDGLWRCALIRSGRSEEILWSSGSEKDVPIGVGTTSAESLEGQVTILKVTSLRLSSSPLLLR